MARANTVLASAPEAVHLALRELESIAERVDVRRPSLEVRYDLAELRGYHYHTGIVFAAYAHDYGEAVARGGRYDEIGRAFGRARPATGFDAYLTVLARGTSAGVPSAGVFALPPAEEAAGLSAFWREVEALRDGGERVVCALRDDEDPRHHGCDRTLLRHGNGWQVQPLEDATDG